MEIHRFGLMKSEFRNPKSERSPKSESPKYYLPSVPRCRWPMPPPASGFGLRVSFGIRHSEFSNRLFSRNPRSRTVRSKMKIAECDEHLQRCFGRALSASRFAWLLLRSLHRLEHREWPAHGVNHRPKRAELRGIARVTRSEKTLEVIELFRSAEAEQESFGQPDCDERAEK